MGIQIGEIEGSKGTMHKITQGRDGVVYCDCWAWKVNKKCKHLDQFFSRTERKTYRDTQPTTKVTTIQSTTNYESTVHSIIERIKNEKAKMSKV